jgi:hypothetical protein
MDTSQVVYSEADEQDEGVFLGDRAFDTDPSQILSDWLSLVAQTTRIS